MFFTVPSGGSAFLASLTHFLAGFWAINNASVMKCRMLASGQEHKIFFPVIGANMIDMVRNFVLSQGTAKLTLHYQTVLRHIAFLIGGRMIRCINQDIAAAVKGSATMPLMRLRASLLDSVALKKRDRMPPEMAQVAISVLRQWCRLAATTFAEATRNLLWFGSVLPRAVVIVQILGRMIAMMRLERDRLPATAGAY